MVGLLKLSEQTTTILGTKRDPPFQFEASTSSSLLAFTEQLTRYHKAAVLDLGVTEMKLSDKPLDPKLFTKP